MRGAFPLIGRERELELAERALDVAIGGSAVGMLISGPPGMGKSRLATEVAERARQRGARIATGHAWDLGGAPPFWPWSEALSAIVPRHRVEAALAGAGAQFVVLEACATLLREASATTPVVIVLEDVHAADVATLVLARFVLRNLADAPVALVLTHRTILPPDVAPLVADLARECVTMPLEGLAPADVEALVASRTGAAPSRADVDALVRTTEGNPLFVVELAGSSASLAALGSRERVPLPSSVRSAVAAHLGTLSPKTRGVLRALATLAPEHAGLGPSLARVDARIYADAIAEAVTAGVVVIGERGAAPRFVHALFGEALLDDENVAEAADRHARAAALLVGSGSIDSVALPERARHLFAAGPAHATEAIEAALAAAERAEGAAGHEHAVRWATAASRALDGLPTPDPERRVRAQIVLGRSVLATGRRDEGIAWLEKAITEARGSGLVALAARAAITAARAGTGLVLPSQVVRDALREAAATLGGDDALRSEVLSALAVALRAAPDDARRQEAALAAISIAERREDRILLARALDARLTAEYGARNLDARLAVGARLVELGESGDATAVLDGLRWRVGALLESTDLVRAGTEAEEYLRAASASGLPGARINATSRLAQLAFVVGRYDDGDALAREACAIGVRAADPASEFLLAAQLVVPLADRARVDELRLSMPPVRAAMAALRHTTVPRVVLAAQLAFSGAHELARHEARLAIVELARGPDDFVRHGLLALLAWVGSDVGLTVELVPIREELTPLAARVACAGSAFALGSMARYIGLAAASAGDAEAGERWLRRALDDNAAIGARPFEARAHVELARMLRSRGDARAREHERHARDIASAIGLVLPVAAETSAPTGARVRGTLRREGQSYRVGLGDHSVLVRESRGLVYLSELLARPGTETHVLALTSATDAPGDAGLALLDSAAKAAYRERVEELREEVAEAESMNDLGRAERARGQLEAITNELARAVGLGGRDRRTGATSERARMAVRVAVRRALDAVRREHPALAAHLQRSVRTGAFCAYDPDPSLEVVWDLG